MFQGKQNSGIPLGFVILNMLERFLSRAMIEICKYMLKIYRSFLCKILKSKRTILLLYIFINYGLQTLHALYPDACACDIDIYVSELLRFKVEQDGL